MVIARLRAVKLLSQSWIIDRWNKNGRATIFIFSLTFFTSRSLENELDVRSLGQYNCKGEEPNAQIRRLWYYYTMFPTLVQSPTVHAIGHGFLKHDRTTGGFSLIFAQSSSFNATCSSFPELLIQSTERIEMPFPQLLEHFCQGPFHHLKKQWSTKMEF